MVGGAQRGVTVVGQASCGWVITLGQVACKYPIGQFGNGAHPRHDLVAVLQIARPFPLRHPVARIRQPVGAHTQAGRCTARKVFTRFGQPHRVEMIEQCIGIHLFGHQVARALIGGQVIIEPAESRLTDAGLLGSTAPVAHIMAASQRGKGTYMIRIHLAIVARHRLCHPPDVCPARAQEVVPKPHGRSQFGIVPGISSHIIAPGMAVEVVGMHHVAIVPEAIPLLLFDGILVKINILGEAALHGIVAMRQRPDAESPFLVEILRGRQQPSVGCQASCVGGHLRLATIACLGKNPHDTGAGNAIGCTHAFLHVLIARAQAMGHSVVMAEIHGFGLRTP